MFLDTLGWVHYRLGNVSQAVELLERAVAGAGELPQLRYHLGMAYFAAEQHTEAKRELQAAVDDGEASYVGIEQARETLARL